MTTYWCEYALLEDGVVAAGILVETTEGIITELTVGVGAGRADRLAAGKR